MGWDGVSLHVFLLQGFQLKAFFFLWWDEIECKVYNVT